jgi:predicted DNA-binding transcriptional regulator YafY
MPYYEINGYGRDTGRKRHRVIFGTDEKDALNVASADGTVVETIKPAGPEHNEPATEKQKRYAKLLGAVFPDSISKDDISKMITAAKEGEEDVERLLTIQVQRMRTVAILYLKPGEEDCRGRIIEPHAIFTIEGHTYVQGYQLEPVPDHDTPWRTFRMDRVRNVRDGGATFNPRHNVPDPDFRKKPRGPHRTERPRRSVAEMLFWIILPIGFVLIWMWSRTFSH